MRTLILLCLAACGAVRAQDQAEYTFGTTAVDSSGLEGHVYLLKPDTEELPKFRRLRPVGTIYALSLNVRPQSFAAGFPGVSDRFEWFAIEYTGRVWVERAGRYRFSLLSDDGSKLFLDGKLVIDNDGLHPAVALAAEATLTRGVHDLKVDYFQGPRYTVALVLSVAPPGEPWRVLHMRDFRPPQDPGEWTRGSISHIKRQEGQ